MKGYTITVCDECHDVLPEGHMVCEACHMFCPDCEAGVVDGFCTDAECDLAGFRYAVVAWNHPDNEFTKWHDLDGGDIMDCWQRQGKDAALADVEGHAENEGAAVVIEYRVIRRHTK